MHAPKNRSFYFLFLIILGLSTYGYANQTSDNQAETILVLGDSLSAAYGIPNELGWVTLLEKQLAEKKDDYKIVNASISGETTDGGLRNLPRLLTTHQPDIVIIELGANDGLRGFPLKTIEKNLRRLITLSQKSGAQTMVVGMHIPPNYGKKYAEGFHNLFGKLAEETNSAHLPFLLDNIAIKPELMQDDQLHPTAEAQPMIMQLVLETLKPLL